MQAMFKCKFFLKSQENEKCEMNMMVGLKSEVCGSRQEVSGCCSVIKTSKSKQARYLFRRDTTKVLLVSS